MLSIISVILCFIFTLLIHILISRILIFYGKKSLKLLYIFAFGLIFFAIFFVSIIQPISIDHKGIFFLPLPLTSIFLYILLFIFFIVYYLSTYSGEIGPSIKLYSILRRYGKRTFAQIVKDFPEKDYIFKRLFSLQEAKFISYRNDTYKILPQGKYLSDILNIYRSIIGWKSSG
jgi:hypothetical protein